MSSAICFNLDQSRTLSSGNGLTITGDNPFPCFLCVCNTSVLKTLWKKGEIVHNEQFLLFSQCFPTVWTTFIFIKFKMVVCCLFQYGRV